MPTQTTMDRFAVAPNPKDHDGQNQNPGQEPIDVDNLPVDEDSQDNVTVTTSTTRRGPNQTSRVWEHFDRLSDNGA